MPRNDRHERGAPSRDGSKDPGPSRAADAGSWPTPGPRAELWLVLATFVLYVLLAVALALTRPPHSDEGHFVNAGAEFAQGQRLAMPMWTPWVPTLDEQVYVVMPLYFVLLGTWFKLVGPGLESMRLFSVLGGVICLSCWYVFLKKAAPDRLVAILGVMLIGLHYDFINLSTTRYDIWAACLSAAALASYVQLRELSMKRALFASCCFLALAAMTHPYAAFGLAGVGILVLALDFRRLRVSMLPVAALPFLVAFGLWGLYVAQDVDDFVFQLRANSRTRLAAWREPLAAFQQEIWQRYVVEWGGWRPDAPPIMRVKTLILPFYALGVIGCCVTSVVRGNRVLVALSVYAVVAFLMLTFFEGHRWYIYLVHVIPIYLAAAGGWLATLFRRGGALRVVAVSCLAALTALTISAIVYRVRLDVHNQLFRPTLEALREAVQEGDLVMSTAELGVGLGFDERVLDDSTLGYESGIEPDLIVVNQVWEARIEAWRTTQPPLHEHAVRTLANYELRYSKAVGSLFYRIYVRRPKG